MKHVIVFSFVTVLFLAPYTAPRNSLKSATPTGPYGPLRIASRGAAQSSSQMEAYPARSNQIRAAMILWAGGAAGLVETITPALLGSRKTWRITHYPQDPTETKINDYDLYDLDQETLVPLLIAGAGTAVAA